MNAESETIDSGNAIGALSAFVVGAAIGAVAALILAPANGRDTRAYLKRRGNELGQDAVERGRETWRTQSERVKSAVSTGVERATDAIGHVRDEAKAAYQEARGSRQPGDPDVVRTSYQSSIPRSIE
jgi:gas vesicle protein